MKKKEEETKWKENKEQKKSTKDRRTNWRSKRR
jgi:hypothetical protein